jgi:hypothetical protein
MKYIQYCVMTSITLTHKFSEVQSCVLTLQTYMEQRSNDTTKLASMLLEIEKHLKIVKLMLHNQSKGLLILILFHKNERLI